MNPDDKFSTTPRNSPPIIVPGMLPSPPITAATKDFKPRKVPIELDTKKMGAINIPAIPARAPDIK